MGVVEAVKACFAKYACFDGRARRSEFWWFYLFYMLVSNVLMAPYMVEVMSWMTSLSSGFMREPEFSGLATAGSTLSTLFMLGVFLPYLGVTIRRLHDTGRSGWCMLVVLIPILGSIIYLVWMASDSDPGGNHYGPNPKESGNRSLI